MLADLAAQLKATEARQIELRQHQVVRGSAAVDRSRFAPWQQIDPVIVLASPDTHVAQVTHFGHIELAVLRDAVTTSYPDVADENSVAPTWWASRFVEGSTHQH